MSQTFRGLHTYRLRDNATERRFAKAWVEENTSGPTNPIPLLAHLLGDGRDPVIPTLRDEEVAATVIQWLGSPVGMSFLKKVLAL